MKRDLAQKLRARMPAESTVDLDEHAMKIAEVVIAGRMAAARRAAIAAGEFLADVGYPMPSLELEEISV